ncbi:MAG: hypothetical protein IJ551_09040 [Prevotella sp.]|nr:hypothetical protein [Prevotella sp.]
MKKYLVFGMMGAMALTFAACSSDDAVNENVVVTKDGDAVKTRFALSLTNDVKTRMAATAAQENGVFNGIKDIVLFPFNAAVTGESTLALQKIQLADFDAFDVETANGKVYSDVLIPVGVNNFLFYGRTQKALGGELKASYDTEYLNTGDKVADKIYFDMVPYNEDMTVATMAETDEAKAVIEALNAIYAALSGLTETQAKFAELTAGNTNSIGYFISDLVDALTKGAQYSDAIKTVVETYFTVSGDDATGYTATWKGTEFPANLNLPDGAVVVKFEADKFAYVEGEVAGLNQPAPGNYVKPAELFYWINTPAKVSDKAEYNLGNWDGKDWNGVQGLYTEEAVKVTTNSVILKDQVEYAVARLDAQVRIAEEFIYDSGSGIDGAADKDPQQVTIPADGYQMTGILIGGQKDVDWQFLPVGSTEYTIWDNAMTEDIFAKQGTAYSAVNHTLALETAEDAAINIAIEFVNTANDFRGVNHQLIPAGSKFYLVAQLNPADAEKVKNNPNSLKQVLKQDYTTIVKMIIGENSLKSAYNVIPDLRSPKLEFGLSVNLEWQEGITFEQTF